MLGGLTTASFMLAHYLERDARFRIAGSSNIQAAGLAELSRADLMPVFGEDIGRNVFFIPLDKRRRELEGIPWICLLYTSRKKPEDTQKTRLPKRGLFVFGIKPNLTRCV